MFCAVNAADDVIMVVGKHDAYQSRIPDVSDWVILLFSVSTIAPKYASIVHTLVWH
jgi:hypothetical protein